MSATPSRLYAHPVRRTVNWDHVVRSAFGIGALGVAIYEVAAPLGYAATGVGSYVAASVGFVIGGSLGLWK